MLKLNIAMCYEPPAEGSPADLQDIEAQADFLEKYLTQSGHTVKRILYQGDIPDFLFHLNGSDILWNLFETFNSREDEQHLGAALLELAHIKYTGSRLPALVLSSDKRIVKKILKGGGVLTPALYEQGHFIPGEWIIKPSKIHGSVGITDSSVVEVFDEPELINAISGASAELEVFAEQYIRGREYSAALLDLGGGLKTIAVAHMQFINYPEGRPHILGFESKWNGESPDYRHTIRTFDINPAIAEQMADSADKAAHIMGLSGFARIDFRMDTKNNLWAIDVNPNPGLGKDAGFIAACAHAGIDIKTALDFIIRSANR